MLAALFASKRLPEPLLLTLDALLYCGLAVAVAALYSDASASTVIYLALCVAANCPRHLAAQRAACNQDATSEGQLRRLPAAIKVEDAAACRRKYGHWLPVALLLIAAALVTAGSATRLSPILALVGAEAHFIVTRVHGDCRGGKPAPMLFALMLHAVAALSGAPPSAALSLQRVLIVWTYFLTGFRKMYCAGLIWMDGKNLQLMLGIQGLYHDTDGAGWNFILMRYRRLCCFASVAVVLLQLALPLSLAVAHPAARWLGFAAAMSFHASNHILWRSMLPGLEPSCPHEPTSNDRYSIPI